MFTRKPKLFFFARRVTGGVVCTSMYVSGLLAGGGEISGRDKGVERREQMGSTDAWYSAVAGVGAAGWPARGAGDNCWWLCYMLIHTCTYLPTCMYYMYIYITYSTYSAQYGGSDTLESSQTPSSGGRDCFTSRLGQREYA